MQDAKGKDFIDKEDFYDCFFQLADLYTDGASASQYAKWVHKRVNQIVRLLPNLEPADPWLVPSHWLASASFIPRGRTVGPFASPACQL